MFSFRHNWELIKDKCMNVGIIGGGIWGCQLPIFWPKRISTLLLLKKKLLGGLSRSAEIMPGVRWDQYYHAILSSDIEVLRLLDEVGLSSEIFFTKTKTRFYSKGGLHSMSSTLEFLRFKPLSLWDKFRPGM